MYNIVLIFISLNRNTFATNTSLGAWGTFIQWYPDLSEPRVSGESHAADHQRRGVHSQRRWDGVHKTAGIDGA